MAKMKKANQSRTATKKAPAAKKVPAAKKAPAKKVPAAKKAPATKKAPAAKKAPTPKKAPAAKKTPAPRNSVMSETDLQLQFALSLNQLEKYWHNKVDDLKKQGDAHNREALDEAINQANKYSALQDMISEFESDWASQTILANSPKAPKKGKAAASKPTEQLAIMPATPSHLAMEIVDDLEDDGLIDEMDDELASDLDFESVSELEFADDSAAFFPDDDLFDEDEDHAN